MHGMLTVMLAILLILHPARVKTLVLVGGVVAPLAFLAYQVNQFSRHEVTLFKNLGYDA